MQHSPGNARRGSKRPIALAVFLALQSAAAAGAAQAADAPGAAGSSAGAQQDGLEVVMVTARRVSERLQDAPASITALSEETLRDTGARNADDFVNLTPGVTLVTSTAEVGDTQINIRGINGARDAEPSVAMVVDGILKPNTAALNQLQGDIVQVEILKGPQGAYYGRNAAAGAIVITTRKPGATPGGRATVSFAEDNTINAFGSFDTPIGTNAGLLISADYRDTDGYYRNEGPNANTRGATVDALENWNVGARFVADVGDTNFDVKAHYGKVKANSVIYNAAFALPAFAQALANPSFDEDINDHKFVFEPNVLSSNPQDTEDASVRVTHDFASDMQLVSSLAYSNIEQYLAADGTSGAFGFFNADQPCRDSVAALFAQGVTLPSPLFLGPTPEASLIGAYSPTTCDGTIFQDRNQTDVGFEARLLSDTSGDLSWQAGVSYINIDRTVGVNLGIDRGFGVIPTRFTTDQRNPTEQLVADRFKTDVYAVFGSLAYSFSPTLKGEVALRFDSEHRTVTPIVPVDAVTQYVDYDGPPLTGGAPLNPGLALGGVVEKDATFEQAEPKLSLTYLPSENLTLYANWGIGFRAGGFNSTGSAATVDLNFNQGIGAEVTISDEYRKEWSSAYEAGVKSTLLDGKLTLDAAGYFTQVHDMQFFEFFVGTFGLLRVVSNIDRVDIQGIELNANYRITDAWSVFGSYNLTDTEIKENASRPNTVGNESPYTPDYTLNLGTQLNVPVTDTVTAFMRVDYRQVGPTWYSPVQNQEVPTIFGVPGNYGKTFRDTYETVDLRIGADIGSLRVVAFAANLFDEEYLEEAVPAPEFGGSFISPATRRRAGLEVSYRF